MIFPKGQDQEVVFLLVDAEQNGIEGLTPFTRISVAGASFIDTTNEANEIGEGWYSVVLTGAEMSQTGTLVFLANDSKSPYQWRDIHQIETDVSELVRNEIEKWALSVSLPIRLTRISTEA